MKMVLPILLALMSRVAFGQQHATSIDQCRADLNLWRSQIDEYDTAEANRINNGVRNNSALMKLTFNQLSDRAFELGQCAVIDPDKADSYNSVLEEYSAARNDRYKFFIERHKLKKQMLAEDSEGKRI